MSAPWIVLVILLSVTVMVLAGAFVVLSRRIESVLERAETWLAAPHLRPPGLQPGSRVHSFTALRQHGHPLSDLDLRGRMSVLLFMKADCVVCRSLSRQLTRQALDAIGIGSTTYVVVRDEREGEALALDPQLEIAFQENGTVSWAFRSSATPQAFVVDADGIVAASGFPNSVEDLRELVRHAYSRTPPRDGPAPGA
jgi:peroxiredoxin